MDEKLKQVLHKVELLCDQNPEFKRELMKRLDVTSSSFAISPFATAEEKIEKIEKYLGLDYKLDSILPTDTTYASIDYSFVSVSVVRDRLNSDFREMMRYRYGTRSHKVDFYEFCKYALLQAEMLLNYYYDNISNNFEEIKQHIEKYNPKVSVNTYKSLVSIPFNVKLWAFRNEYTLSMAMNVWDNIRNIRNDLSHRTPQEELKQDLLRFKRELEEMGWPLKNDMIDTYAIKDDTVKLNIYNTKIKSLQEYKNYCFAIWLQKKDFDEVISTLSLLINEIKDRI